MKIYDLRPHELLGLANYANTTDDVVELKYQERKKLIMDMRQGEMDKLNGEPLDDNKLDEYDKCLKSLFDAYTQLKTEESREEYTKMEEEKEQKEIEEINEQVNAYETGEAKEIEKTAETMESPRREQKELDYPQIRKGVITWKSSHTEQNNEEQERW